ncbi:MAG: Vps62-related protein [Candidatus Thalassarchaeaceae archaeon]
MSGALEHTHDGAMLALRSVHGKYLSAQPDGRAEWNREHADYWEHFRLEKRHGGKIAFRGAHGMYVSAQPDGSVQINRREAPPGGWEEFTVEDRGNNVVCLKSCHGKYLSAQQNGTAQWNRDHAPRGGWEEFQIEPSGGTGQRESATITAPMPSYVIVAQAGSPEVNGNYEFMPGKHENRHWSTIAGHYQHTQNPEIFIAFQDCGTNHQRPEWNKWMIISKVGVLYAAHTGGKIGVPPREGVWENVEGWGNPGAPGGKHPAPTVYHPPDATTQTQQHLNTDRSSTSGSDESIQVLEAVSGKPVRFKLNNPPNHNEAWVGIYPTGAPDQDHGAHNQRWKYIRDIDANNVSLSNGGRAEGDWNIRVFSDGGYTLVERKDFTIHSAPTVYHPTDNATKTQEKFEFVPVSEYDEVWNDSGSGAEQDVSVWRPRVPPGCHLIGMTAKNGHSRPTFPTLVIRAGGRDIAPPERFDLVWWQERGKRRFWCWRPIPPAGYVSLGDVGTTSETPPSHNDVVCVALARLSPNRQPLDGQIWNDRGGGAPKDAAFFTQPGGTGLFRCSDDATHNKPHGEFPIPAGASTSPHTTQATNGIEILEAVVGKPLRFRISNRPSSNDAWVGIYPPSARDQDHGEQNKRWKWLREIDVNNASFPEQSEGDWSVRIFSDGGHTLHERKDFAVKPKHVVTEPARARPNKRLVIAAFVTGMFLFGIGLPLFIGGQGPAGYENLGMIIPGAIMFGIGGFLLLGTSLTLISSWAKSHAETGKPAPRWTWVGMLFAVLLLIPGVALLVIGSISSGAIHHEETAPARLWITDADGMGDQGFIIYIQDRPGDFDNNGIHDYCEFLTVNATHSGPWVSDPWTSRAKQNEADPTRQAFELEIAHHGSGCDANVWPEQKGENLVKLGRACYGCMAGYTDISASLMNITYVLPMWIQDGEKVVEATGMAIAGSIMSGIGSLSLVGLGVIRKAFKARPTPAPKDPKAPSIEVLEALEDKPVRFRINDPPSSSSAWVGIYPFGAEDEDHGEEGERWKWLSDIDISDASFPARRKGSVSIRVFSDGGHTSHSREDFDITPASKKWWEE